MLAASGSHPSEKKDCEKCWINAQGSIDQFCQKMPRQRSHIANTPAKERVKDFPEQVFEDGGKLLQNVQCCSGPSEEIDNCKPPHQSTEVFKEKSCIAGRVTKNAVYTFNVFQHNHNSIS
ncbi:unnamed protein product [Lepidochelys kempii]